MKEARTLVREVRVEMEGEVEKRARDLIRTRLKEIEAAEKAVELANSVLDKLKARQSDLIEMDVAEIAAIPVEPRGFLSSDWSMSFTDARGCGCVVESGDKEE